MNHVDRRRAERKWYARISFATIILIAVVSLWIARVSPESSDALREAGGILNIIVPTLGLIVCVYLGIGHRENLHHEGKEDL